MAGLPVDEDALAKAVTAKALDRTIVIEALLQGLDSPEPVVRRRAAERVTRMPYAAPQVAARLNYLAIEDADAGVRNASAEALRAHGHGIEAAAEDRPRLRVLLLRLSVARSGEGPTLRLRYPAEAPLFRASLDLTAPGEARLELSGLPADFTGTRPLLRAARQPGGPLEPLARAEQPVSDHGEMTLRIPLEGTSPAELEERLGNGVDLAVPAE